MFSLPRLAARTLRPVLRTPITPFTASARRYASTAPSYPKKGQSALPSTFKYLSMLTVAGGLTYFLTPLLHADTQPQLDRSLIPAPSAGYPPGPPPAIEQIESGSTHVPSFPNRLFLTKGQVGDGMAGEYVCLGLGVRVVTIFRAHVYVVGSYVHVDDLGELQRRLTECVHPKGGASMCTPQEREFLEQALVSDVGNEMFNKILGPDEGGRVIRTALRVVPSRNTRFNHLKDGWVRGINARLETVVPPIEKGEEVVIAGEMGRFKDIFREGNRNLLRGQTMLLLRSAEGALSIFVDVTGRNDGFFGNGKGVPEVVTEDMVFTEEMVGGVDVEKFTRALWLQYLAGKKVSSGQARENIVKMMVDLTAKPLGTPTQMAMYP